jgi:hypothetical protein
MVINPTQSLKDRRELAKTSVTVVKNYYDSNMGSCYSLCVTCLEKRFMPSPVVSIKNTLLDRLFFHKR